MNVPSQYTALYNDTWNMFGAMTTTHCEVCGCTKSKTTKKTFGDAFRFLKVADTSLATSDVVSFAKYLTAANTLLNSL